MNAQINTMGRTHVNPNRGYSVRLIQDKDRIAHYTMSLKFPQTNRVCTKKEAIVTV